MKKSNITPNSQPTGNNKSTNGAAINISELVEF